MNKLSTYKISFWHRLMHWIGMVDEFHDVYCIENDEDNVYTCYRCSTCNYPRDERILMPKAFFLMPMAGFKDDIVE